MTDRPSIDRACRRKRRTMPLLAEGLEQRELLSAMSLDKVAASQAVKAPAVVTPLASPSPTASTTSLTVPLKLVKADGGVRIAVNVSVAGSPYRPYLLDTGSTGMFVANHKF